MINVTTDTIPGYRIVEVKGFVNGNTVRSKNFGRDLMAGLKNFVGGELKGYTQLLQESRSQAIDRMNSCASELGANAVVAIRLTTSAITPQAAEISAYGTAVVVERVE